MSTNKGEDEIVEEILSEKEELKIEKENSNNQGDREERGVTIEQLIDKTPLGEELRSKSKMSPNP